METEPSSLDKLLCAVGAALAVWSLVELQICALFYNTVDMKSQDKARTLFDGILSFEIRLGIVDRLMSEEATDEIETEMWSRMSARLTKAYKKRHQVAHFSVLLDNNVARAAPFVTWSTLHRNDKPILTVDQIKERTGKFNEMVRALNWFVDQAVRRRWPDETSLPPAAPEPESVPQLRALAVQILEERLRPKQ